MVRFRILRLSVSGALPGTGEERMAATPPRGEGVEAGGAF